MLDPLCQSDSQLEVAITALKYAMPDEFPDFDREYYTKDAVAAREAEKKEAKVEETEKTEEKSEGDKE